MPWGAFWGLLPDTIEWKTAQSHWRSFLTHSPYSLLLPGILGTVLFMGTGDIIFGIGAIAAWGSHLLLDSFNPTGIPTRPGTFRRLACIPHDSFPANFGACVAASAGIFLIIAL
jgi:membrane-bound metal-dependent hydrolase YbcI (DUF457 family)